MAGTHVALLRGINVGRAKRVAMAELRALVEGLGYRGVRTLLNSGNVVFTAPRTTPAAAAARIEAALAERLGIASRVTALAAEELAAAVAGNPLVTGDRDPSRLLVAVLADPEGLRLLAPLTEEDWHPEALALGTRVAYLWCPAGVLESRLPNAIGRALGDAVTTRNWATMTKLDALLKA
jgi:uncharacterized protein (DUF1697 family)